MDAQPMINILKRRFTNYFLSQLGHNAMLWGGMVLAVLTSKLCVPGTAHVLKSEPNIT